jgi:hypothetical protein
MIGYALGRTVMVSDRPLIRSMTAPGGSASFADLAVKIVGSRQFRYRAGESGSAAESSSILPRVSNAESR